MLVARSTTKRSGMLTFDRKGSPLCAIVPSSTRGGHTDSNDAKILYFDPTESSKPIHDSPSTIQQTNYTEEDVRKMSLQERRRLLLDLTSHSNDVKNDKRNYTTKLNETVSLLPSDTTPDRIYVAGASGVGKSCWSAMFVYEYHLKYPSNKIYMYSTHTNETAYSALPIEYQELKTLLPVSISEGREVPPPTVQDFKNSLVIFDDVDNLQSKPSQEAVIGLQSDLLANGRKYGVSVMVVAHQLMNYKQTRNLLSECFRIVFFPQSSKYHVLRFLKIYAGLQKIDIDRIMNTKSRWICLQTLVPNIVISEHEVFIL